MKRFCCGFFFLFFVFNLHSYQSNFHGNDLNTTCRLAFTTEDLNIASEKNKIYEKKDGYFDPGKSFDKRLRVKISGGVDVKKVTYKNPLEIELIVSTVGACKGKKRIFIANPDGQKVVSKNLFEVI